MSNVQRPEISQPQEKPQFTSMAEFVAAHKPEEIKFNVEFEKALEEFDELLFRHRETNKSITQTKLDLIKTGDYIGLDNSRLLSYNSDPADLSEAYFDPRLPEATVQRTTEHYLSLEKEYNSQLNLLKDQENSARLFAERVLNNSHSKDEMKELFAHVNAADYRLSQLFHNEKFKNKVKSNLIKNHLADSSTTELIARSSVANNDNSSTISTSSVLPSEQPTIINGFMPNKKQGSESGNSPVREKQDITISSITDINPNEKFSSDSNKPKLSEQNSTIQPVSGLSEYTAFSADSVAPAKVVTGIAQGGKATPQSVKVDIASPDSQFNNIQTYEDKQPGMKLNEDEDKSLSSYADGGDASQGKSQFSRVNTNEPLSEIPNENIHFGFGQTPMTEGNPDKVNELLEKPIRGEDENLVQNLVPPKRTEMVRINTPLQNGADKSGESPTLEKPELVQENRVPVVLIRFYPNGDEKKVTVDVKQEMTNPEVDHFQNKLNELKERVAGNTGSDTSAVVPNQEDNLNYQNIFADPMPTSVNDKIDFFGKPKENTNIPVRVQSRLNDMASESKQVEAPAEALKPSPMPEQINNVETTNNSADQPQFAQTQQPVSPPAVPNLQNNQTLENKPVEDIVLNPKQKEQSTLGNIFNIMHKWGKRKEVDATEASRLAKLQETLTQSNK